MKQLPVPALDATLERLEAVVAGVVDDRTLAATRERIAAAHLYAGPAQRALDAFAAGQDAAGGNWMAQAWLTDYLAVRAPLPLSTNVTFQVGGDFGAPGLARAARFLHRAATVHLSWARGETAPEVDARGAVLDDGQWACLDGGLRHPRPGCDAVVPGPGHAEDREIGLIRDGRLFVVPAADDAGRPLPEAWFAAAVHAVVEATGGGAMGTVTTGAGATGGLGFVAPSVLGSGVLAEPLARLLADEANEEAYRRLAETLFTCTIVDEPAGDGGATERLRRATVTPGRAWVYKPISYGVSLADGWIALHCEHSTVDGATLVEVIRRIQAAPEVEAGSAAGAGSAGAEVSDDPASADAEGAGGVVVPEELTWRMHEDLAAELREALAHYAGQAARFRVDVVRVPRPDVSGLPMRVSADFLQQAVMAVAQRRAFGRVRSVYESVDMREYAAGRTECLRPVTPAMAALAEALADGPRSGGSEGADAEGAAGQAGHDGDGAGVDLRGLFTRALDAHRAWVKACKAGSGVDRHLWGLGKAVAGELGGVGEESGGGRAGGGDGVGEEAADVVAALLADPGVRAAREDFLSTTSIGGAEQIVRYAFAPSVPDGFGISYTPGDDEFEYCVSSWSGSGSGAAGSGGSNGAEPGGGEPGGVGADGAESGEAASGAAAGVSPVAAVRAREEFLSQLGPAAAVIAELVDELSTAEG